MLKETFERVLPSEASDYTSSVEEPNFMLRIADFRIRIMLISFKCDFSFISSSDLQFPPTRVKNSSYARFEKSFQFIRYVAHILTNVS